MSIHFLLSALRARFRVFILILLGTVLTATIVSLLMPKTYIATASLLVDSKDDQSMGPQGGPSMPERERAGYMQTQLDILKSERVARKVVRDLKLAETYETLSGFDEGVAPKGNSANVEDWLAAGLLKHLKLDSSTSSIIRVGYASSSPEFSKTVANAFAKAYMDTVLDLRVEPSRQTAVWFEQQAKGLRDDLEKAQAKLSEFERAKGIIAADDRYDTENSRLTELSTEVARAQSQSADMASRAQQARAAGTLPEVLNNPLIQNLKTDLARSETRLREMSAQLGVNHPAYQRQLAETQELRTRVETETRHMVAAIANSASQSRQREAGLLGALEAQRQRMLNMRQYRAELSALTHDVEAARRAYDTAMQRAVTSRVEGTATHANVSVLNPAVEPAKAARPKVGLNIGLSIIAGLMFALGAVGLMETFDRRVRSIDDLEGELHVPLLAELNPWDSDKTRLLGVVHPYDALPGPG